MRRMRPLGLSLVAAFALSAVAATAAQALPEGPFYKVEGNRLLATETKELKAKAASSFTLEAASIGVAVTCTSLKLKPGATIVGSTGENAGTSEEVIEFSGCTVTGNGEGCKVENEAVTTSTVEDALGYSSSSRSGPLLVSFHPKTGKVFVELKFVGAKCILPSTKVEGTVVGEAFASGKQVEVTKNEVELTSSEIKFGKASKTVFVESGGVLTSTKAKLTSFGIGATLEGTSQQELAGGSKWGIFT